MLHTLAYAVSACGSPAIARTHDDDEESHAGASARASVSKMIHESCCVLLTIHPSVFASQGSRSAGSLEPGVSVLVHVEASSSSSSSSSSSKPPAHHRPACPLPSHKRAKGGCLLPNVTICYLIRFHCLLRMPSLARLLPLLLLIVFSSPSRALDVPPGITVRPVTSRHVTFVPPRAPSTHCRFTSFATRTTTLVG